MSENKDEAKRGDFSFSLVIPVFNEEQNLEELIRRCLAACRSTGRVFEIIMVDDGSRDMSPEILRGAAEANPGEAICVILNRNYGQHSAVMAGFAQSRGDIVLTIDADLQNPPEEIPKLVSEMGNGYDVVGTVRVNRRDNAFRRAASFIVNRVTARVTGIQMHDYGCMLRAYDRRVVDAMLQCRERSTFIPVLANSFAKRTTEIAVSHSDRAAGESKYGLWKLLNLNFDLLTSMTTFPLRLLSILGAFISAFGMAIGVYILVMRVIMGPAWAAEGVFTLFALMFFFIGAQFVAMGLLGEYIGRTYTDVRARPRYFIEEIAGRPRLPPRN